MPELIGKTIGGYTILEQVGRGGMATVFKALDLSDGKTVAIKILFPQLAVEEKFSTRFRREAKLLRGLKHPNIVPILDYGEANGLFYFVMPFMQVGTLSDRMLSGKLRVQEAARIIDQTAAALQYAHDAGVIHRDVKPSNILLDEEGNAWLSDFGFARIHDASLSLTGSALIGTPAYISPEQINGDKITHLSDQYSLGVVLYQLSTGRLPYDADTPLAIAIKHATEPLPRPRAVNPNLPDAVEAVLIKALAKDPDQRFRSIAEFNQVFKDALQDALDPVSGLLRPGAVGKLPSFPHVEATIEVEQKAEKQEERKTSRGYSLALLLLLLLALPLACWGINHFGFGPVAASGQGTQIAQMTSTFDLMATVNALSTVNAPSEGTIMAPGQVETYVAATLTAMATDSHLIGNEWTETPFVGTPSEDLTTTATWTPMPSITSGISPSATRTKTRTPLPSKTSSKTPTGFISPTPSRTMTPTTYVSPTRTPTKTQTVYFSPTPSRTLTPTKTLLPTAILSPTPVPPSPTPTQDPCKGIDLNPGSFSDDRARWEIINSSSNLIVITDIWVDWPEEHEKLEQVKLNADKIWDIGSYNSPTTMPPWTSGTDKRDIKAGDDRTLEFRFKDGVGGLSPSDYGLYVTFDNGCTISP